MLLRCRLQRLMRIILMLISFFIGSCAHAGKPFPAFPSSVKEHYLLIVKGQRVPDWFDVNEILPMNNDHVVRCLRYRVKSVLPYKIEVLGEEPVKECHMVGGWKDEPMKDVIDWSLDAYYWVKTNCK